MTHQCVVLEEIVAGSYARCVDCGDVVECADHHFREAD
jgi:hypothetical protein